MATTATNVDIEPLKMQMTAINPIRKSRKQLGKGIELPIRLVLQCWERNSNWL
jgi:hypothetical protein